MALDLELGQLGKRRRRPAADRGGHQVAGGADGRADVRLDVGRNEAPAPFAAELHHQRLVPDGGVVAPQLAHRVTSASAETSRSMSDWAWTSVTQ